MAEYKLLKNIVGSSLGYGSIVYFTENGKSVPYILVHKGTRKNFLFLRQYATDDKVAFHDGSATAYYSDRVYQGRTLDNFMTKTFYNRFTEEWKKIFVEQSILTTSASYAGVEGISSFIGRKVFAPSATELGIPNTLHESIPNEGAAFEYFKTNANNRRKCYRENDISDSVLYSTRSKNNTQSNIGNRYYIVVGHDVLHYGDSYYNATVEQNFKYYCRPVISINENVTVVKQGGNWVVIPNLPPEKPTTTVLHTTLTNGDNISLQWNESPDEDGPQKPIYRIQRCIDSGEWITVTETADTSYNRVLTYKEAESSISYRVQAYDEYQNASEWTHLANITVVNNLPPLSPSYISINGKYKGENIVVSWGSSTDEDDNLAGYKLYRCVNNGSFALIAETQSLVYRDVAGDWDTVKYRVFAYDEAGAVSTEYKEAKVVLSSRITMGIVVSEDSDITEGKEFIFVGTDTETDVEVKFSIEDTVEESYVYVITVDDIMVLANNAVDSKGDYTHTIGVDEWRKILNGEHYITITVYNSEGLSVTEKISFVKRITGAYFTLKNPVTVKSEDAVTKFLVNVSGYFPEGSLLEVKVTNNANDDSPTWQTVEKDKLNTNEFIDFTNTTVENGNAFNIIIKADRGTSAESGYISSVSGMFGRNLFEYIFERLAALEAGAANV